ncbi:MAG: hypothetical protein WD805_06035 [Gaiellaceae bacterium]
MARQSREAALSQAKAAKQKKLLFLLVPIFLGLAVWQGPKTLKALTGGNVASTPPAATLPVPTTPAVTPAAPLPTSGSGLNETDPVIDPLEGQLVSFSSFESKDPFAGLGDDPAPTTTSSDAATTTSDGSETDTAARAVIEVNGSSEDVVVNDDFPASDPAFRLISVNGETVTIGLVSGSFSTGTETIEIDVGETYILVSETDGSRYVIRLVSVAG